jgi:wobble nucleotide-excising tRNase
MKKSVLGIGTLIGAGLIAGQAYAFTCPVLIKGANESIAKAETAAGNIKDDREKGGAMVMIELAKQWTNEAQADHKEAGAKKDAQLHYRAMAKAKAAKALMDQVK